MQSADLFGVFKVVATTVVAGGCVVCVARLGRAFSSLGNRARPFSFRCQKGTNFDIRVYLDKRGACALGCVRFACHIMPKVDTRSFNSPRVGLIRDFNPDGA